VIVMHHAERRKASNTGRLAALALTECEVRLRGRPLEAPRAALPNGRRLLLYPSPTARVLTRAEHGGGPVVLLVPDGNWTQAQRAARRDPDFEGAEHVALPEGPPTRYALRRGTRLGSVCTLEAIARALGVLEGPAIQGALESVMDRFVERTLRLSGNKAELERLGFVDRALPRGAAGA
jgi:DTW domain-containing protein YfiP